MAASFYEMEFPRDIAYGSNFGPSFSTDVAEAPNHAEQRNMNWKYPYCTGNLATGIRKQAQFTRFYNFWLLMHGKAFGFRYYDWLDHAGKYMLLGIADGTTTAYQLYKNYIADEMDIWTRRKIVKPIADTVKLYEYDCTDTTITDIAYQRAIINNFGTATPSELTGWTVDTTTGIVTFTTAPAARKGIVASFEFDVPVRFDTDKMVNNYEAFKAMQWSDIPIVELRFT